MASNEHRSISSDLISIVMPVKNGMPYLIECLDSIRAQSWQNWELLVVDDHSTDNTRMTLQRYAKDDSRISVYSNEGKGIIEALRTGYQHATGTFVSRMDADDRMTPQKLHLMSDALQHRGRGHVAVGCVEYFADTAVGNGYARYAAWLNKLTRTETNFDEIYKECVIPSPNWMMFRDDFDLCGGFECDRYPEDYDLCFRMYRHGMKVVGVDRVTHQWRDYATRTSRTDSHYADNRFLAMKLMHFCAHELVDRQSLVVWGAGQKGKKIARYLIEQNVPFHWLTNNSKKIGLSIYDKFLQSTDSLHSFNKPRIIVAVANATEQLAILEEIHEMQPMADIHLFC